MIDVDEPIEEEIVFIRRRDCPFTLTILDELVGRRSDAKQLGYDNETEANFGAYVNWSKVLGIYSSSEKAAAQTAKGIWLMERHGGGYPQGVRKAIRAAVERMTS